MAGTKLKKKSLQRAGNLTEAMRLERQEELDGARMARREREDRIRSSVESAMESDHYAIAIFRVADGKVHLSLEMQMFPNDDLPTASRLLREEFSRIIREAEARNQQERLRLAEQGLTEEEPAVAGDMADEEEGSDG